jgi:hypothetical protein
MRVNDQFEILSLTDLQVIHELSDDKWSLSNSLENLEFTELETSKYESIRRAASNIDIAAMGEPSFHQIIFITDGIEDSPEDIVKSELYFHLSNSQIPIHTVGLPIANRNEDELREWFAISRITGGGSFTLDENSDTVKMTADLYALSFKPFWLSFKLPATVLDGSVRHVSITLNHDLNRVVIERDLRVPAVAVPTETPVQLSPPSPPPAAPVTEAPPPPEPWVMPIWLLPAVGAVLAIIVIVIVLHVRKKAAENKRLFRFDDEER